MGDRVAEYLEFLIMLVTMTAVITLGASFMFFGRKMQNMFFDSTARTYADVENGSIRDLSVSDTMEVPAAAALTFIYDVYDNRDLTNKEFSNSGQLSKVIHKNPTRRNTSTVASVSGDTREKMRVAVSYFTEDLNKKCKITAKINKYNPDYYDIYIHDVDCEQEDQYHIGPCKTCKKGTTHAGNCDYD